MVSVSLRSIVHSYVYNYSLIYSTNMMVSVSLRSIVHSYMKSILHLRRSTHLVSVSLRSIVHSYYKYIFDYIKYFCIVSVSLRSIVHSYKLLKIVERDICANSFRLLTEYRSFLCLIFLLGSRLIYSLVSVSLRSIVHSYVKFMNKQFQLVKSFRLLTEYRSFLFSQHHLICLLYHEQRFRLLTEYRSFL